MLLTWRSFNFPDFYVVKKVPEGNILPSIRMDQSEERTRMQRKGSERDECKQLLFFLLSENIRYLAKQNK